MLIVPSVTQIRYLGPRDETFGRGTPGRSSTTFQTKERLLAQAFAWAAEQDLNRLDAAMGTVASPLEKIRKIIDMVRSTVHERVVSRRQLSDWVRVSAARELGLSPTSSTSRAGLAPGLSDTAT